jgi:hypothetical protein
MSTASGPLAAGVVERLGLGNDALAALRAAAVVG